MTQPLLLSPLHCFASASPYLQLASIIRLPTASLLYMHPHIHWFYTHIDGLVQERCNYSANALELRLYFTNQSILSFYSTQAYRGLHGIWLLIIVFLETRDKLTHGHRSCYCAVWGWLLSYFQFTLQWRHNGRDGVWNHQPRDCLLNCLFRHRLKKTSKLRMTGLCEGNSPGTGEFPAQMDSNAEYVYILMTSSWSHPERMPHICIHELGRRWLTQWLGI